MNRAVEYSFGTIYRPRFGYQPAQGRARAILRSADITVQIDEPEFRQLREETRVRVQGELNRIKEEDLARNMRRMFNISPLSWTYSALMTWIKYDEIIM